MHGEERRRELWAAEEAQAANRDPRAAERYRQQVEAARLRLSRAMWGRPLECGRRRARAEEAEDA